MQPGSLGALLPCRKPCGPKPAGQQFSYSKTSQGTQSFFAEEQRAPSPEPDGGADKDRTCDLLNAIQALYQLSYDPIRIGEESKALPEIVKTILHFELAVPDPSLRT